MRPELGNIGARLRGVKKLFDLDERFREMDQFGDYREIISLPNPPIEDFASGRRRPQTSRGSATTPWRSCARGIPERFPTFVAAVSMTDVDGSVKEARRAVERARRRRHPDLHQYRRAGRSMIRPSSRSSPPWPSSTCRSGCIRPAPPPCRTTRPSRNRASRCGGASAGRTKPRWRWCGWCSTGCSTAIRSSRSSPITSAA